MLHVPDTGPGRRVTGAGARTDGREAARGPAYTEAFFKDLLIAEIMQRPKRSRCGGISALGGEKCPFPALLLLFSSQRQANDRGYRPLNQETTLYRTSRGLYS
jgi:hypothetical protein